MIRMPLATASLLAIAISLAGCGDKDKEKTAAAPTPAAATSTATPATDVTAAKVDEAAAKAVVAHYADMVHAVYSDAESTAKKLQTAIDAFLAKPNDDTLKAARAAWVEARVPYLQSEVFRFGNTIIDDWEGQVNAWPLDEGLIDYVDKSYEHALGNPVVDDGVAEAEHFTLQVRYARGDPGGTGRFEGVVVRVGEEGVDCGLQGFCGGFGIAVHREHHVSVMRDHGLGSGLVDLACRSSRRGWSAGGGRGLRCGNASRRH